MGSSAAQRRLSYTVQLPKAASKMPSATMPTPPVSPKTLPQDENSFAMQKYLILCSQHEELRQNLDDIRSSTSTTISSTPSVSPTRSPYSPFVQYPSSRHHSRRSSFSAPPKTHRSSGNLPPLLDESMLCQVADEERKLFDVNEGMKRALTEMLNGDRARQDGTFRTWVQCRLMDTEKELRMERRRKSAP